MSTVIRLRVNDTERAKDSFRSFGAALCHVGTLVVLICHCTHEGQMDVGAKVLDRADMIFCCHPVTARKTHPEIANKIVGDWDGQTHLVFYPNHILVKGEQSWNG